MKSTHHIAVIFDFDDTLVPDSTSGFLENIGIDPGSFWSRHKVLVKQGWDPVPAYLQMMIEYSKERGSGSKITRDKLKSWGTMLKPYPGVSQMFSRVRKQVESIDPEIEVEFYIISSGIGEIIRASKIAREFSEIWTCDFAYDPQGEIQYVKNVVSFSDKTRFLFYISKGLIGKKWHADPFAVNRKVPRDKLHLSFDQMIVIGDGYTDIPCFSLVQEKGGVAIGVYDRESRDRWGRAWGFLEDKRVSHLVAADYRKRSGLDDALFLALDKVSKNIVLREMSYQG